MTIVDHTTENDQRIVDAWCANLRTLWDGAHRPLHPGDPRLDVLAATQMITVEKLLDRWDVHHSDPDELAEALGDYYIEEVVEKPDDWPIMPYWAVSRDLHIDRHEVTIVYRGAEFFGTWLERLDIVYYREVDEAGHVTVHEGEISICDDKRDYTLEAARDRSRGLALAVKFLESHNALMSIGEPPC